MHDAQLSGVRGWPYVPAGLPRVVGPQAKKSGGSPTPYSEIRRVASGVGCNLSFADKTCYLACSVSI